jgi:hypothetical protein
MIVAILECLTTEGTCLDHVDKPVFSSKPSLPWSVFSLVGIWLLDRAEN